MEDESDIKTWSQNVVEILNPKNANGVLLLGVPPLIDIILGYAVVPIMMCRRVCLSHSHIIIRIPTSEDDQQSVPSQQYMLGLAVAGLFLWNPPDQKVPDSWVLLNDFDRTGQNCDPISTSIHWDVSYLQSICLDPRLPNTRMYVGDNDRVKRLDRNSITGHWVSTFLTRFDDFICGIRCMMVTDNGKELVVSDYFHNQIRIVNIENENDPSSYGSISDSIYVHSPLAFVHSHEPNHTNQSIVVSTGIGLRRMSGHLRILIPCEPLSQQVHKFPCVALLRISNNILLGRAENAIVVANLQTPNQVKLTVVAGESFTKGNVDGLASRSRFNSPLGMCFADDTRRSVLICDVGNLDIRELTLLPSHMYE